MSANKKSRLAIEEWLGSLGYFKNQDSQWAPYYNRCFQSPDGPGFQRGYQHSHENEEHTCLSLEMDNQDATGASTADSDTHATMSARTARDRTSAHGYKYYYESDESDLEPEDEEGLVCSLGYFQTRDSQWVPHYEGWFQSPGFQRGHQYSHESKLEDYENEEHTCLSFEMDN